MKIKQLGGSLGAEIRCIDLSQPLSDNTANAVNFGNLWHTDFTNLELRSYANALYSLEVPPAGGDTLFMSTIAAFDALSPRLQALLNGLNAVHCTLRE